MINQKLKKDYIILSILAYRMFPICGRSGPYLLLELWAQDWTLGPSIGSGPSTALDNLTPPVQFHLLQTHQKRYSLSIWVLPRCAYEWLFSRDENRGAHGQGWAKVRHIQALLYYRNTGPHPAQAHTGRKYLAWTRPASNMPGPSPPV